MSTTRQNKHRKRDSERRQTPKTACSMIPFPGHTRKHRRYDDKNQVRRARGWGGRAAKRPWGLCRGDGSILSAGDFKCVDNLEIHPNVHSKWVRPVASNSTSENISFREGTGVHPVT